MYKKSVTNLNLQTAPCEYLGTLKGQLPGVKKASW